MTNNFFWPFDEKKEHEISGNNRNDGQEVKEKQTGNKMEEWMAQLIIKQMFLANMNSNCKIQMIWKNSTD